MPVTVSATNRDHLAIDAIRTRLGTISGLWAIQQHDDLDAADVDANTGVIVETIIGGPARPTTIGATVTREFTRQLGYYVKAPTDSQLAGIDQAKAIEEALYASPITIAPLDPDGPIAVMILDVTRQSPRPPAGNEPKWVMPVLVLYRFHSL